MDVGTRVYLGSLFLVLGLLGVSPAQNSEEMLEALNEEIAMSIETASESEIAQLDDEVTYMVRLRDDGLLKGRLRMQFPTGKNVPVDAKLHFKQDGEMVDSVATDDAGEFAVAGLSPGDYVATAEIETGSADFAVKVLPFEAGADPEQMVLNATLSPIPELEAIAHDGGSVVEGGCAACGELPSDGGAYDGEYCDSCAGEVIYDEEIIADPCCEPYVEDLACGTSCCGGFSGGCGGGCGSAGGRGLGWLLGAGGLAAGITALAINDGGTNTNPFVPTSPAAP